MRILILGHRGNLGSQWEKFLLLQPGIELSTIDREDLDITQTAEFNSRLAAINPEIIINTVAYNAVDQCETVEGWEMAKKLNGQILGGLADFCLQHQATLIHYSTDYVFSGNKPGGYLEGDIPDPISNYGRSKLLGEQEVLGRASAGLKYYLIRTSKLFGPCGSGLAKPSFFDIMRRLAADGGELKVVDGETSCFTYTPDLVKSSWQLAITNQPWGIYHLVNSHPATWLEGARTLFDLLGQKVAITPVNPGDWPRPAQRPKASVLLNTKVEKLRDYQEALIEYLNINK